MLYTLLTSARGDYVRGAYTTSHGHIAQKHRRIARIQCIPIRCIDAVVPYHLDAFAQYRERIQRSHAQCSLLESIVPADAR